MKLQVGVPGSCGELIQGTLQGVPFLVTCPVNIYTIVTVTDDGTQQLRGLGRKARLALSRTLEYLGCDKFPFSLQLDSEIPIGKGMASSSADIAAVAIAAATALEKKLTPAEISRLAAGIEPTDGVFFPGIVRMNQMTGECLEELGELPALKIAAFDCGGFVDTLAFHERQDLADLNRQNELRVAEAISWLMRGSAEAIAAAATQSALANQTILKKQYLEQIIVDVKKQGALGVNVAHSGTVIGVLFAPDKAEAEISSTVTGLQRKYPQLQFIQQLRMISGGYRLQLES